MTDDGRAVRPMSGQDFEWAAARMERRRPVYATFAPVFWRPAAGVAEAHADFLRSQVEGGTALGLRSAHGFVVAAVGEGRYDVDDFAVEDGGWSTTGRELLRAVLDTGPLPPGATVRVVTARRDTEKREMLRAQGLTVSSRWWVAELHPAEPAEVGAARAVDLTVATAVFVPAPPVYAPGGPVCLLGDMDPGLAVQAADRARELGAVLAVVARAGDGGGVPAEEPVLAAAGFENVSEFYGGTC